MNPNWEPSMVSESETDRELAKHLTRDEFNLLYQLNPAVVRRRRQIFRWWIGYNRDITRRLVKTRERWGRLVQSYLMRCHYRRSKLLALTYQQLRLTGVHAVEGLVLRRVSRFFNTRLTPVLRQYVATFI